jgi:hypothetical protein
LLLPVIIIDGARRRKIEEDHYTQPENKLPFFAPQNVCIPVAVNAFPHEQLYQAPRSWAERAYRKLIYYKKTRQRRALRGAGTGTPLDRGHASGLQAAA